MFSFTLTSILPANKSITKPKTFLSIDMPFSAYLRIGNLKYIERLPYKTVVVQTYVDFITKSNFNLGLFHFSNNFPKKTAAKSDFS